MAYATEEISLIPARTGATQAQPSPVVQLLIPDPGLPGLPPARRLLVLVPGPTTLPELANRIWSLAVGAELEVLFIGMAGEGNDEYTIRRLLATLAAATRDRRLRVDTKLVRSKNWLQAICALWQPGDLIICHSEQTVPSWGFRRRPLAQALIAALNTPVYVLAGFCPQPPNDEPSVAGRLLRSATPFLIIAGSFVLQVQIEQSFTNWLYYLLMTLSIIIELALLAIWNSTNG
jgi:hypothetical protein